ncbi:MAG: molybdenum cofactor biosynthesis protein MoaE [Euryarchaeota archaeon]|nr:molybdenum cofactor biosynthesis protein MoaE [Euryarchaeota archaeon]
MAPKTSRRPRVTVRLQTQDFSLDAALRQLKEPRVGGLVFFVGTVRGIVGGKSLERLEYQAYRGVAEKELRRIGEEAIKKFGARRVTILHRIGKFRGTQNVVLVAVSAAHRQEAFDACEWLIDTLKVTVPIWKKEVLKGAEGYWIQGECGHGGPAGAERGGGR